jgi:hypothetical protein
MHGHYSTTINYRPSIVGNGFAAAQSWPMDLQEVCQGC